VSNVKTKREGDGEKGRGSGGGECGKGLEGA
jgi:hypothetical protein